MTLTWQNICVAIKMQYVSILVEPHVVLLLVCELVEDLKLILHLILLDYAF